MNSRYLLALIGMPVCAASGHAHHSFSATYNSNETLRIEGTLVQFLFRNPHSWVHVMAPDENGEMKRWGVEWGGTAQLRNQGVRRDTLRPGDKIVITGLPGRNAIDHRILMRTLHRASDGFGWGNEPGEVVE